LFNNKLFKIVNPIWYFNQNHDGKPNYWIDYKKLKIENKDLFDQNCKYQSKIFKNYDIAFQLWHKGLIDIKGFCLISHKYPLTLSLYDQYLFLRRMYNSKWIYYAIFIRILTFQFSFNDIRAIISTKNVKKIDLNNSFYKYVNYKSYLSQLIESKPFVSIIIPTLNRYSVLDNALKDLENQNFKNFEVLIIDQSNPFQPEFYDNYNLKINLFYQKKRGLWNARNNAIRKSKSDLILFFDDDSRVSSTWINEHLKCIDYFNADISSGVSISKIGAPIPIHYEYFRWSDQLDTGNVLIKRKVFKKCGLFDLQFEGMRMGDGEFGLRAYLSGFKNINNPKAKRIHLKTEIGGLREMGSWDGMRPKNWLYPRPIPSVLYFYRRYWGSKSTILYLLQTLPISLSSYKLKGTKLGYIISLLLLILFFPFLLLQVLRSWTISNKMLKKSQLIEDL